MIMTKKEWNLLIGTRLTGGSEVLDFLIQIFKKPEGFYK